MLDLRPRRRIKVLPIRYRPVNELFSQVDVAPTAMKLEAQTQKRSGAYYTPDAVVETVLGWALRSGGDRLLDPACGDGRFIARHQNSFGIEQDAAAAKQAIQQAPSALVLEGDFFSWAASTAERFDCAAGNPPFIRYQTFKGDVRDRALRLCASVGARFSGLTSSWAPFLVATATLLRPGGRLAFVVPAEIGHAPYAAPLIEFLAAHFALVHVVAVREKLFPDLSEDCWLLYAAGFGQQTDEIRFSAMSKFRPLRSPPRSFIRVPVNEWRSTWNRRLRPFLIDAEARELYREVVLHPSTRRFGEIATVGIGYVSGANDFFHLRPSEAIRRKIPSEVLWPSVRNGRALPADCVTAFTLDQWQRADEPMLLLRLPKRGRIASSVSDYLDSDAGHVARLAYKCRVRDPWYSIPDVQVPDFFLSYMSGRDASLVRNEAGCTGTNSVHVVRMREVVNASQVFATWNSPFVKLSCELEGHPLGGGMLKLEPREATQIALPAASLSRHIKAHVIEQAVSTMREWRHYDVAC